MSRIKVSPSVVTRFLEIQVGAVKLKSDLTNKKSQNRRIFNYLQPMAL